MNAWLLTGSVSSAGGVGEIEDSCPLLGKPLRRRPGLIPSVCAAL